MSFSADDARHMARAVQLAAKGLYSTDPNPRVGCVIAKDGVTLGEGWHVRAGESHAEVLALASAGTTARGADVFVTLEPCNHYGRTPPCTEALIRAGVRRVVAAMRDPNPLVDGKGFERLAAAGITCEAGLLEGEAAALNPGFVNRMRHGRPYVRVKIGASLDGRTALASGESRWITGEAARADVQRLRARSSAVVTGVATVLADDPALTVRDIDIGRQPLRVVLDSRLRTPPTAQLLRAPGRALIATTSTDAERQAALATAGAEVMVLSRADGRVDLPQLLLLLAQRGINEVLVEAGPRLAGAFMAQGLADELVLYIAPLLLGDDGRGMFHLPHIQALADQIKLDVVESRAVGSDWRITAKARAR